MSGASGSRRCTTSESSSSRSAPPRLLDVDELLAQPLRAAGVEVAPWVELSRRDDIVRVRVSDDGVGPPAERQRGSGLVGIEERVAARGGRVELVDRPGGGTVLDVTLPVGPLAS